MELVHPGIALRPKLEKKYGTLVDAARDLGFSDSTTLHNICHGRRAISTQCALRLERGLRISATGLLKRQVDYEIGMIKKNMV